MEPDAQSASNESTNERPSTAALVTGAIIAALLISMARVFVLAQVFGYAAANPDQVGGTLFTTFILWSVALVSVVLCSKSDNAAVSRSISWAVPACIACGMVYGLFTKALLSGVFCGACIGCGAGYVAGLNGLSPTELNSGDGKKLLAVVFAVFCGFGLLGFLTPVPLVPKAVYLENRKAGEAAVASGDAATREATAVKEAAAEKEAAAAREAATEKEATAAKGAAAKKEAAYYAAYSNPKGKLTALKAVVAKFKQFPDRFTPDSQREAYSQEMGRLVREFTEYPFNAKVNPSVARSIVELFEAQIQGNYSGYQYSLIDECVRNIYAESLNR
jgi:hypothetical protein